MNPKVAVVILVVIVGLFIVAVASGACHSGNTRNAGWVETMQHAFVKKQALKMSDVTATPSSCISGGSWVIPAGAQCVYRIASSNAQVRQMKVTGGTVTVSIHYNNNTPPTPSTGDLTAGDGDRTHVGIYSAGGTVTVTCDTPVSACMLVPSAD
ncbi:MAG TPA: hypothetical protein VJT78_12750 [Candidatus Dormibacteraeota bacterium]|nr:hypothetical protein [Candidatus Dormibacteraeota bacterium]